MKYLLLTSCGLLCLSGAANAQDVVEQASAGVYVGVEGGYENYDVSAEYDDGSLAIAADGLSGDGLTGGIFAGYQTRMGEGFMAIEAFGRLSSASMSASFDDGVDMLSGSIEAKESYGIAAKAGIRVNRSSGIYARVGWVNTRFELSVSDGVSSYTADQTEDAIEYGGGLETLVGRNYALRVEYVRADYGSAGLPDEISVDSNGVRAGFSYRF